MTAKSVARLIDPHFGRVPMPALGKFDGDEAVEEHSPMIHEVYGEPMPEHFAGGGDVYGDNSKIRVVGSHEGEHRLVPISPKNTNYRHVMEYVPIEWLLERRGNEYRHSPERMAQLRREIEEEGLREPVLISVGKNSRTAITGEGNHRVLAAHQLGYTHIPVRAMVGDAAGSDVFPEGAHDEDIIPKPNKYFPSEAKPSRVMRSLGYEGQEELPERWWDEGYAAGGEVDDQHPYAVPNDLGLYSHAAVTAAGLPQERGTPEQFRGMLLNKGVKPAELHWGEYDYAFGDKPEVTRDEVAKHLWASMPNVEEKVLRRRQRGEPSASEISEKHYRERQSLYDEDLSPAEINQRRREMRERHAAERASAWHHDPYHEVYTIPGGENYREILLKHGSGDMYPGVPVHFGGEPDILTSMMVKDRQDHEGDKVFHIDELQSDWAQKGRQKGFRAPIDKDRFQRLNSMPDSVRTPEEEAELSDMYKKLQGIEPAPYVTKTEDWVDLGLKRALREAAEKGYDKLAWSPGSTIADRYNLAKHVNSISHEKNDDGTYNISIADPAGGTFFKQQNMTPEKVASYLGKGVAEKVFAGEGLSNQDIRDREIAARKAHLSFLDRLAENDINNRINGIREEYPDHEYSPAHLQMMRDIVLQGVHRDPAHHAKMQGLEDEHQAILDELKNASDDYYGLDTSRDYRHLKTDDLQVGEKWPFEMYDRMIPKRALRLAKMHDPEAQLEKSTIEHDDPKGYGGFGSTDLGAIRITPKMRESILKRGFPAHALGGAVEGYASGGEVEGYADGGDIDPAVYREFLKKIHSPLSENPESVQQALKIAGSYRAPTGMETGVGSLYSIKQSMPASAVTRTIQNIPGVNLKPKKQGSWEDFYDLAKGNEFVNVGGDLSGFGRLTHINGKPLAWPVDLHAGADYMREPNPGRVWANIGAHATSYRNKIREANERGKELYGILSPMGASAVNSSHNMFDTLMAQIPNADIDPDHLKEFDEAIKRGDHIKDLKKSKPKVFAEYLEKLEKWPGLENAKEVSDFARPHTGNINGGHRTKIVEFMDKEKWRDRGFPEVGVTRAAITNPDLMGTGGNKLGFRVVKLSNQEPKGGKLLFQHSTYPVNTFGEYVMDVPLVQRHYAQPDVIDRLIMKPTKSGQIVHPYSEDFLGRSTARKHFEEQKHIQPVNERFINSVMMGMENQSKYGFKQGGAVRKALMIAKGVKKK